MRFITIITLLTYSSCSSLNINKREISNFESPLNCHKDIKSFFATNSISYTSKYTKYIKYNNPLEYTKAQRRINESIETWVDISQREISIQQMNHNSYFSKIQNTYRLESEYAVAQSNKFTIKNVETIFYLVKYHKEQYNKLIELLDKLSVTDKINKENLAEIKSINDADIYSIPISTDSIAKTISSVKEKLNHLGDELISEVFKLNNNFDEYYVTRNFLEEKSSIGEQKAQTILNSLSSKKILSDCKVCKTYDLTHSPSMNEMRDIINNYNIPRIIYLKKLRWQEVFLSISSRLPDNYMYRFIDIFLEKMPKLKNSEFRQFLRKRAIDTRDKIRHFPQIDRILFSSATNKELIDLIANIDSQTANNEFLIAFARRVDAQDKWTEIYTWLKANLPNNENHQHHKLSEAMTSAWAEAQNRGPMPQWHTPEDSNVIRFAIDTIFLGSLSYGGYEAFREEIQKVEDLTGIDLIKQQEALASAEDALVEAIEDKDLEVDIIEEYDEIIKQKKIQEPNSKKEAQTLKELFSI